MKKTKFGLKAYMKPTPVLMRKVGDGIIVFATTISTYAIAEDMKVLALCSVIGCAVGKFVTNLFTQE
jgi:hypothetical protein